MNKRIAGGIIVILTFTGWGCGSAHSGSEKDSAFLVSVGDSTLYEEDVVIQIPSGLTPEDSLEMFHRIVDNWVETRVLEDVAKENIVDMERIDRLTSDYRNRLIVDEYLRRMGERAPKDVSRRELEAYYKTAGDTMILRQPILKGIYLRTSVNDPELENIRKWISSEREEDIDLLEKKGLREATGYEFFADRWVSWDDLSRQIPYRVEDADKFLKENSDFETIHGSSVYFLHVVDFLPSGSKMPKDYALEEISERIADRRVGEYRKNLKSSIYQKAIKDGKMKKGTYNPLESI